jgi:hypothetical protein
MNKPDGTRQQDCVESVLACPHTHLADFSDKLTNGTSFREVRMLQTHGVQLVQIWSEPLNRLVLTVHGAMFETRCPPETKHLGNRTMKELSLL